MWNTRTKIHIELSRHFIFWCCCSLQSIIRRPTDIISCTMGPGELICIGIYTERFQEELFLMIINLNPLRLQTHFQWVHFYHHEAGNLHMKHWIRKPIYITFSTYSHFKHYNMFFVTKFVLISIVQQLLLINPISLASTQKNYAKVFLNGIKPDNFLFVPFMNRNENGKFNSGIEFKLLEAIVKKEQLDMTFVEQYDFEHRNYG